MTPAMPRFRRRLLAIRRERLALQNASHKIASRLQNPISRLETLRVRFEPEGFPRTQRERLPARMSIRRNTPLGLARNSWPAILPANARID